MFFDLRNIKFMRSESLTPVETKARFKSLFYEVPSSPQGTFFERRMNLVISHNWKIQLNPVQNIAASILFPPTKNGKKI